MQADSAQQQGLYRPEFDHDACGIGALADINGERHHQILDDALSILVNLEHRGGTGLEKNTGDGAGILFQVPHHFFRKEAQKCGQILPAEGDYGVAMLFFPQDDKGVEDARRVFEEGCAEAGVPLLFWREVPVDPHDLGETARACMPTILQAFLGRPDDTPAGDAFERRLYVCRRTIEKKADAEFALRDKIFYVCSMSSRTIVYKGMLVATQMRRFFIDLNDAAVKTAVALVHSRYSTNTTPSWERAHPNRFIIHNGEINTLKGNVNWIRAREPNLYSPVLQHDLERVMPIINREGSDSAILDNVLEFLVMNGRPLTRAASMLLPEPWDHNDSLSEERRAYDAYQSMLMEPWDGPAAIAFTDGRTLGAALDRNGLRPARYYVTRDGRFMLASEVGTIEVSPENILTSGCLGPGQMLEVDFARGRVIYNEELRARYAKEKPYRDWIAEETLTVDALDKPAAATPAEDAEVPAAVRMAKLGYHWDDVDEVVRPMAQQGKAPLASMGIDAPLACLSKKTRSFYDYFYQLFAQVTNPPIDALREHMVTSTTLYLGNHGNLLEDSRTACQLVRLERPLLNEEEFERICAIDRVGFKTRRFRAVYRRDAGEGALQAALKQLAEDVEAAVRDGVNIVVLSDRAAAGEVPVPSLLAVGCVHNHLIRAGVRTFADIVVECGDAVSPHDFAALVGYSASGIYPYNAHACIRDLAARGDRLSGCAAAKHVSAVDGRLAPVVKDPHLEPCEIGDRLPHDRRREASAAADEIVVLQRLERFHLLDAHGNAHADVECQRVEIIFRLCIDADRVAHDKPARQKVLIEVHPGQEHRVHTGQVPLRKTALRRILVEVLIGHILQHGILEALEVDAGACRVDLQHEPAGLCRWADPGARILAEVGDDFERRRRRSGDGHKLPDLRLHGGNG